ncbi:MAG TPA: energy transducer TonB [Sphingobium sp.]
MATMRSSTLSRPGVPAMASLAVNGLLIAALLTLSAGRQERWVESPSLSVLSLAALKGSDQGEEQAPTAEPQAAAQPDQSHPVEQQQASPPPVPATVPPPPPLPSPLASPATQLPPVAAATTPAAARNPASSPLSSPAAAAQGSPRSTTPSAAPQRRGVADGLDADAPAGKSMAYAARVRSWLYAHKVYPRRARMRREEGIVRVRFILDRTGALIDGMILAGSGKAVLDEEAMAMMRRASPYPRAPDAITGDRLEFIAPIEFTLPV